MRAYSTVQYLSTFFISKNTCLLKTIIGTRIIRVGRNVSVSSDEEDENQLSEEEREEQRKEVDAEEPNEPEEVDAVEEGRSRKRKKNREVWKKNIRQHRRNSGQEYISTSNKKIAGKVFENSPCSCKKKCFEQITPEMRQQIFKDFWKMGNLKTQNCYLVGLVGINAIKQRRPRSNARGGKSRNYVYNITCPDKGTVKVCKSYFLKTFSVSDGRLTRCLSKQNPTEDKRGHHPPSNKTPEADITNVKKHIESFPTYISHYCRQQTMKKYLPPPLTLPKMYDLYVTKYCPQNNINKAVSYFVYTKVFKEQFNLSFKTKQKDTCRKCDSMKIKIDSAASPEEKLKLSADLELHHRKAETVRAHMRSDKSNSNDTVYVFTFDLEKTLPVPDLSVGEAYYKRQLWVYNLGVHSFNDDVGHMYMWHEGTASRGSQEVTSCITRHLKEHLLPSHTHVISYSDCCSGQNRNFNVVANYLKMLQDPDLNITTIEHKFMVSGHSFLPNDADFGVIEAAKKHNTAVHVPTDWYEHVRLCKRKKPFQVHVMENSHFFSTDKVKKCLINRKTNEDGETISWLKIQWLKFTKEKPFTMMYKYTFNELEAFKEINLKPKIRGRISNLGTIHENLLYSGQRKINPLKLKDLKDLLIYVPPVHHDFYKSLKPAQEETPCCLSESSEEENDSDVAI